MTANWPLAYIGGMRKLLAGLAVLALVASGCGASRAPTMADGGPAAVIQSVREALRTDRIRGATLNGSRLTVRLRPESASGEAAISLWYGKLLVQEVVNRLKRPVTEAVYTGTSANGGADRRFAHSTPPAPLPAGACRKAAMRFPGSARRSETARRPRRWLHLHRRAQGRRWIRLGRRHGRGRAARPPRGPNARPTLIEVIERGGGTLRFVLLLDSCVRRQHRAGIGLGAARLAVVGDHRRPAHRDDPLTCRTAVTRLCDVCRAGGVYRLE